MVDGHNSIEVPESAETVFRFFCRHLVCLGGWVQPINDRGKPNGEPEPFAFSSFVLEIRDIWHLLTAGHILKGIERRVSRKEISLINSYLLAGFGPEVIEHSAATHPIYFDYENTPKDYLDRDGLDFGLLTLSTYLRSHLEANRVEPVREDNWRIPVDLAFEDCVMLGFPQEFVDEGNISPTMVLVRQLHELPEDVEQTPWPRFIGKLGDRFPLKSLVGMSGGPIYGFNQKRHPDRYWIPAIQSSWLKERKITFGCPVPLLARFAEECLYGAPN